jgi:serine/threonine protein kinase
MSSSGFVNSDAGGGTPSTFHPSFSGARCACDVTPISQSDLDQAVNANSVQEWIPANFQMVKHLQVASRNYGRVEMMRMTDKGKFCAVKVMPNKWIMNGPQEFDAKYPNSNEHPWKDIALIKKLNDLGCPYVCEFLGIFRDERRTWVVMSLATEGDLFAWCNTAPRPGPMREMMMRPIVGQIASAVKWLHDVGVAHRDLSLENILLTDTGWGTLEVKLIDFGMLTLQRKCIREKRGKRSYQAPEMHSEHEYYDAYLSDAFALGVVIFSMAANDYPWMSTKRASCKCFDYVCTRGFSKLIERRSLKKGEGKQRLIDIFTPLLARLLKGLLEVDPSARLTLGEACWAEDDGPSRASLWITTWMQSAVNTASRCTRPCKVM